MSVFLNEGFEYYGVDITDSALPPSSDLERVGWEKRVNLTIFTLPKLDFSDDFFFHSFSTEALHLNPNKEAMTSIISEYIGFYNQEAALWQH